MNVKRFMQISDSLELSAVVRREGRLYVALCPEFDVASQGKSIEEALANLKEALELYWKMRMLKSLLKLRFPS